MQNKKTTIALIGCPNAGKSSLFNSLTGARQKVANYSGVTVEKKIGEFTIDNQEYRIIDLPGVYSLKAHSEDERITRDVITGRNIQIGIVDLIICVVDSTNLKSHLRLVMELKELQIPMIVALNMNDIALRRGFEINKNVLSEKLGLKIVTTISVRKRKLEDLSNAILQITTEKPINKDKIADILISWQEPSSAKLRLFHNDVIKILKDSDSEYGEPPISTYKIDNILLHPVFGLVILFATLLMIFQAVFSWSEIPMNLIDNGIAGLANLAKLHLDDGYFKDFIINGLIAGVGSVIIFLPQIVILYFFILLLEDSGYMARASFLLDKIMSGSGLNGKSFIPLLSSFACAIPGIMATRTIGNEKDRLATILIAPLMTCSARIPVYTLIISAFIPRQEILGIFNLQGLVMLGLYVSSIIVGFIVAFILKRLILKDNSSNFIMELPIYHLPYYRQIFVALFEKVKIFLYRAGTIIFVISVIIWFLSNFPAPPIGATGAPINYSFAGKIGNFLAPLFAPIGFNWQIVIALIPGMAAREVVVAALGTVYASSAIEGQMESSLATILQSSWSLATALSFLAWYVFAPQCTSTIAVIKRETASLKWTLISVLYMLILAYLASFVVYNIFK